MANSVIKVENVGKLYHLGQVGTGTMSHDLNRWWHKVRGKEDPYLKLGEANDRTKKGASEIVWALRDINFEVKQGEVLGIIGKNGAGKSTLLKILSRVTTPTVGEIKVKGRIASLLEVGTGFHPELTGRENIFLNGAILGMSKQEIRSKFDEIVDFSGVERYIDTPVKRYSSGMYVRLAFGVAAHLEPEILIVDEVLAVGDAEFQKKCLGKMKDVSGQGRTVLFVSHNMAAVKLLCSRAIMLEKGKIAIEGDVNSIIEKYFDLDVESNNIGHVDFETSEKHLKIKSASLLNNQNQIISNPINIDESFKVKINYKFERRIAKVHLTFIIMNSMGETVYFLDRRDFAFNYASVEEGEYQSVLEIKSPLLKPGKYYITFGCEDEDDHIEDHKFNALSFTIDGSSLVRPNRDGYLFLPIAWELNKK